MIQYPDLNPNAITIGSFSIKWYGVCYLIAFSLCYWQSIIKKPSNWSREQVVDLLFYLSMGVIFGGRLGYILFYCPIDIIDNPLTLLQFWLPGRSFHGGLLGVLIAIIFYAKKNHYSFLEITDFIAPIAPIGIACGRIGNFINGELWGRVTDVSWGMVFAHVDQLPRHPSQIYEFLLEGVMLFLILNIDNWRSYSNRFYKNKSALFLIFYALFRIFVENYREPDFDQGFIVNMTMGQILSIPMLIAGFGLLLGSVKKQHVLLNERLSERSEFSE